MSLIQPTESELMCMQDIVEEACFNCLIRRNHDHHLERTVMYEEVLEMLGITIIG